MNKSKNKQFLVFILVLGAASEAQATNTSVALTNGTWTGGMTTYSNSITPLTMGTNQDDPVIDPSHIDSLVDRSGDVPPVSVSESAPDDEGSGVANSLYRQDVGLPLNDEEADSSIAESWNAVYEQPQLLVSGDEESSVANPLNSQDGAIPLDGEKIGRLSWADKQMMDKLRSERLKRLKNYMNLRDQVEGRNTKRYVGNALYSAAAAGMAGMAGMANRPPDLQEPDQEDLRQQRDNIRALQDDLQMCREELRQALDRRRNG